MIPNLVEWFLADIPCAVQREAVLRRHGIFAGGCISQEPVFAQRHYAPQRARDDNNRRLSYSAAPDVTPTYFPGQS